MIGSWHGDLRRYKHKNLLVILFTCKVASRFPEVTSQTFANLLLRAILVKQGCGKVNEGNSGHSLVKSL